LFDQKLFEPQKVTLNLEKKMQAEAASKNKK
jgi:hypothetical protein